MRILAVTSSAPWFVTDGASMVLDHHLRYLAGRHEVTVFACGAPAAESPANLDRLSWKVEARWFGTPVPRSVDYLIRRGRAMVGREPAHVHWVERPSLVRALRDEIARRRPDVLHLHGWGTAQLSRLAAGIPSVHVPMDAWGLGIRNRLLPGWRRIVDRGLEPRLPTAVESHERRHYPRCRAVVVVAELDAGYLRDAIPGIRVEVIPNGVEAGPEPIPPPAEPVLGFHGVFETAANRDAALTLVRDIFPQVRRARPDARLMVIGRGPESELRRFRGDGVVVTGGVDEIRPWLDRVAVYVAPMVTGTGLKNKVLEAMAAGRPVVGTSLALEGIGAGPGVLTGDSPQALAEHVVSLFGSADLIAEMGRQGRDRVLAGYTWKRSAEAIERLWRELAS